MQSATHGKERAKTGLRALYALGALLLASAAPAQRAPSWDVPVEERNVWLDAAAGRGGRVFVSGREQVVPDAFVYRAVLAALDEVTGAVLWVAEGETATGNTGGATSESTLDSLALSEGVVVAGGMRELDGAATEGVVRAYDQATGTLLWAKRIPSGDYTKVAAAGGVAFAATLRSAPRGLVLEAYDLATGDLLWDEAPGGELAEPLFGGLAASRRAVAVVGSEADESGGTFVSVHDAATGTLLWDDLRDEDGEREFAFAAAVSGRRLFVAGVQVDADQDADELVLAYDLKLGTPLWTRSEPRDGGQQVLALVPNGPSLLTLGLDDRGYEVRARHARSGAPQWDEAIDVQPTFVSRALAARGRRVVVAHDSGGVGLDARTGQRVWDATRGGFGASIRGKQAFIAGMGGAAAYPVK